MHFAGLLVVALLHDVAGADSQQQRDTNAAAQLPKTSVTSLASAVADRLVDVSITGTGGASGDVIEVRIPPEGWVGAAT